MSEKTTAVQTPVPTVPTDAQAEVAKRKELDAKAAGEWAKTRESLKAQFGAAFQFTESQTPGYVAAGAIGFRFVHGAIVANGSEAGKLHGKTWTASVKELTEYLESLYGQVAFNVSLIIGAFALKRVCGDWVEKLPWSLVRTLVPLLQRDDTFPGLERMTDASAPAYELAYSIPKEWEKGAKKLLAELENVVGQGKGGKGKLPTFIELEKRRQSVTGTKARGRGKKTGKGGKGGKGGNTTPPETGPIADAVKRFRAALGGKGLKDVPDARRTVVKKAVASRILTASDISTAILAIAEDDSRSPRERKADLRQVKDTLVDTLRGLQREADKAEAAAARK